MQVLALLLVPVLLAPASAAEPATPASRADAEWILSRLARPAPMRTGFVEVRGSALLKAPLRLTGEYRRPGGDTLVREVRAPYAETTTIQAGEVRIERTGRGDRTFSLSRAPELAALQASFGALLSGDRALLEKHYVIDTRGSRRAWTMALKPRDAGVAARLQGITLHGRGAELRCIETRPVKGDVQRTLLAGAARSAATVSDAAALAALCSGTAA
ncbi:LolA-related protein [Lysobacter sp. A3-1-A15]|uniref:LolA-related protein n=1 Tax=Novilysobacter viscosus TaxID=3098602 RepID=UPI002EDB4D97